MEGLRHRAFKEKKTIIITDIKPGFVNTAMAKGENLFWVIPVDIAAKNIYQKIKKKKTHAYITSRWRLIAWLLKFMPSNIYNRFF